MPDVAVAQSAAPFESASELREAHARLLEAFDSQLGEDASSAGESAALARLEPEVRLFLERGAATGVYLEETKERTSCQVLLDYWLSSLAQAGLPARSIRLARFDAEQLPDLKNVDCPYVGLDAFRDETYFFGRESDTKALLAQVRDAPLVVVLGASGSGKSSLVMGGVLPALTAEGTLRVVPPFFPGNAVLERLVGAEAPPTLITIDQFEEVFTLSSVEDREGLAASLAQFLEAGYRVILTMREEFRSRIVELRALSPYLDKAWYSMRPMDYDELRAAVEKPAALVNLQFQAGIVDDLVKKVLGQPAALPLLQFTLRLLWEERDRNRITWEVYGRTGDPLNALKASADDFYDGLAPQTQIEVRRVLLELVRVDELLEAYRQPVPMSRLLQTGKANTEEVIKLLADNDYVRITAAADAVVEVKHESLVRNWPRFVGWIDDKRRELRQRLVLTQAARQWAKSGKPAEGLLTGWQLDEAKGHSDLSAVEEELVQASAKAVDRAQREREDALRREVEQKLEQQAALEQQQRNRRNAALVLAGAFVVIVLVVLAGWFALDASRVREQLTNLLQETRMAKADRLQDVDYGASLLVNLEAVRTAPTLNASYGLLRRFVSHPHLSAFLPGDKVSVKSVAFSPDGKRLASANEDGAVILWDVDNRKPLATLEGHKGAVLSVAFSPDGSRLASASADKTVILWDVDGRKLLTTLKWHTGQVYGIAFSPDGKRLASASEDQTVILWDVDSRESKPPLAVLRGHKAAVKGVAFSSDGMLASASLDSTVILWDLVNRKPLALLEGAQGSVYSIAFSPNGKLLASASLSNTVNLWDVVSRKLLVPLEGHQGSIYSVAFSSDGKLLASASKDQTIILWDVDSRQPLATLEGHKDAVLSVAFSPDGKRLASASADKTVILWAVDSRKPLAMPQGQKYAVWGVAFSPDSKRLAAASLDKAVLLWDLDSRKPPVPLEYKDEVYCVAFSPDGKQLASASKDQTVILWDLDSGKSLPPLQGHKGPVYAVAFSPDGKLLASASMDQTVILWDLDSGKSLPPLQGHKGPVYAVAFSPDGKLLASVSKDKTVILWDVASRKPLVPPLQGHEGSVSDVAFSPDGELLASASDDQTVKLWSIRNRKLPITLKGHKDAVWGVAFSPDGKRLASASRDKTVILWDVDLHKPLATLKGHKDAVVGAAFSPDGKWLASSSQDQTVILWDLDLSVLKAQACRTANRNLTCDEWRDYIGAGKSYRKTCEAMPGPERCD